MAEMSYTLLIFLILYLSAINASPPVPIISCAAGNTNCTLTNAYGAFSDRSTCLISEVAYPSDEAELLRVVSSAASKKQHMRAVTVHGHSIPKLGCPGGPSGRGLAISTLRLNKVVGVDKGANRMTVEPGMTLREFIDAAATRGLALPHAPYFQGMTVGGLLATASHGSSLFGKGSAVHEHVVGMRVVVPSPTPVDGLHAKVIDLKEGDEDLLAAKVSLGLLGVVSQITFQLEPMFKRSITYRDETDEGFESNILSFGAATEFGDISWFPSQSKVIYRHDFRVPVTVNGSGISNFAPPFDANFLVAARTAEETREAWEDATAKCSAAQFQFTLLPELAYGFFSNDGSQKEFRRYPVIGFQNDMQGSALCINGPANGPLTVCTWDPRVRGVFYYNLAVSIPLASIAAFVADVKKLRDANPQALCCVDLYIGFLLRFIRNSTAYLGRTVDSVDVDMLYYRSHDAKVPRLFEDVMEEIEQMAVFKYDGEPHLGKNRNVAFLGLREKLGARVDKFVEAMGRFDPEGLFSSEWTDAVLGLRGRSLVEKKPGCALDGMCICSKDEHCAPHRGYVCRSGLVYKEARVCRKIVEVA